MGLGGGWGGGDGLQKVGPFLETTCSSVQDYIWWLFLHHEDFGESSAMHFFPPALFFFKVELTSCTLIPLFMPGLVHSGSAS